VGIDLSARMTDEARRRAEGTPGIEHRVGTVEALQPDEPFDALFSRFGVMFFDDPVAAFRNIGGHLRPGGRIAFACWQARTANPWFFNDAIAGFVPPPVPPAPGAVPPGPFALGDAVRTTELLERAGFSHVRCTPRELVVEAPEDAVLDEAQLGFLGVPDEKLASAMEAAKAYMSRFRIDDERSRFPLAMQLFQAVRP
jgi:SAM-dependent methyltransferase